MHNKITSHWAWWQLYIAVASYKDDSPTNTVARIKSILDAFDITTTCSKFSKDNLCFSSRVEISVPGIDSLHVGTNGKGMNEEYSLASGYAEFMERLQNKMLLFEALKYGAKAEGHHFDFRFFPDESVKNLSCEDFLEIADKYFPNYKFRRFSENLPARIDLLTVPFLDAVNNCVVDVPIEIARANSTTGMCAGNTPAEALVQGINEILERYVLQVLYKGDVTPPDIPVSEFDETNILNRLKELERDCISFEIKDCSLGLGFPVVGLVLFNKVSHRWTFRLGADSDPIIALERCFTEIFQGKKPADHVFSKFEYDTNVDISHEYAKSLKDGTGKPPLALLGHTPSYPLRSCPSRRAESQADELKHLIAQLHQSGFNLYFRDNSFMGFPSYQIVIPGLSDQMCELVDIAADYVDLINNPERIYPLYHIKSLDQSGISDLYSKIVNKDYPFDLVHLFPYCLSNKSYMSKHLLLFMLAVACLDYTVALGHLTEYLDFRSANGVKADNYLICLRDFIHMKSKGADDRLIKSCLMPFYDEADLLGIIDGFSVPAKIFANYAIPECFGCNCCLLKSECRYHEVLCFEDKIQEIQKSAVINQQKLLDSIK